MTLIEAIEHCKELSDNCTKCGKEHLQLKEWLEELKRYRETVRIIENIIENMEKAFDEDREKYKATGDRYYLGSLDALDYAIQLVEKLQEPLKAGEQE